jgi:MFS family permease
MRPLEQAIAAPLAAPAAAPRGAIFLLMWVSLFNVMDRQIVNILAELIRADLKLTDAQLGLLTGLAFALFYAGLSLPLARLAETRNRAGIIAASLALWSLFTALGGLTQTFTQLLVTRLFVGVGEAGSGPASQSLAADITPPAKRASAMATAIVGVPLGTLLGMAVGGWVGGAYGWRTALICAGLPGLVLALIVRLLLKDPRPPPRRGVADDRVPLGEALKEIAGKRSFLLFTAGSGLLSITSLAVGAFAGSFFLRVHAASLTAIAAALERLTGVDPGPTGVLGLVLGVALGLSGAAGVLIGGALADAGRACDPAAYMRVAVWAAALAGPLFAATLLAPSGIAALVLLALPVALCSGVIAPVLASAQSVVRPRVRATAAALLFIGSNFVALGFGPLMVGSLSDAFAPALGASEGLRWALLASCLACPLAAGAYALARRSFAADLVG